MPPSATPPLADPADAHRKASGVKPRGRARATPATSKRVGIREIARKAEVSVATVSMVLNDNPKITEATRKKVRRVMDQVGYQPNRLAQSLSGRYTRMLAVLLPTLRHALADPYFGELISGIGDRAARLGHKIMLEHAKPEFIKDKRHIELLERRFVDGVLCLGFNDRHPFLADFKEKGYPAIAVNNRFPQWGLDHVSCDYRAGGEQVMTYLLQLGHRRLGMVHGSPEAFTSRELIDVFRKRTDEAGLGLDESWLVDGRFTEEHGYEAAEKLVAAHPDITAIFAGNDKMALGVLRYLTRSGRRVPQDVSVVGCDDIQHTAFVTPTLTTVHLPLYEVGSLACDRLVHRVRGKAEPVSETLPTHLVLRESTGIVPGSSGRESV